MNDNDCHIPDTPVPLAVRCITAISHFTHKIYSPADKEYRLLDEFTWMSACAHLCPLKTGVLSLTTVQLFYSTFPLKNRRVTL